MERERERGLDFLYYNIILYGKTHVSRFRMSYSLILLNLLFFVIVMVMMLSNKEHAIGPARPGARVRLGQTRLRPRLFVSSGACGRTCGSCSQLVWAQSTPTAPRRRPRWSRRPPGRWGRQPPRARARANAFRPFGSALQEYGIDGRTAGSGSHRVACCGGVCVGMEGSGASRGVRWGCVDEKSYGS